MVPCWPCDGRSYISIYVYMILEGLYMRVEEWIKVQREREELRFSLVSLVMAGRGEWLSGYVSYVNTVMARSG